MATKSRLLEIFSKVNKTVINEASEINDNLYYAIKSDLIKTFENNKFHNGVPTKINTKIQGSEVELLLDQDSIKFVHTDKNVLVYYFYYNLNYNDNNIKIRLPIEVDVETIKTETIVGFKNIIHPIAQEIEITII